MISVDRTLEVNPEGTLPNLVLTQDDVWGGLLRKAEDAVPYVREIEQCRVLERDATGFTREIYGGGEWIKEHITLEPKVRIVFERLSGSAMGTIQNCIEHSPSGALLLRFQFDLELQGADAAMEAGLAKLMEDSYLDAVQTTLLRIREDHLQVAS